MTRPCARPLTAKREGYAFPMALAAIIIITLVIGMAATQVERAIETYTRQVSEFDRGIAVRSAEQTFLYHALTSPMGNNGVEIGGASAIDRLFSTTAATGRDVTLLRANGTPLRYDDDLVVRYIDQQSFFDLSSLGAPGNASRASALGIAPVRQNALQASLTDYQDGNDVRSPGGAEASFYDEDGMPPNRPLLHPLEICRVRGWREESVCADPDRLLLLAMPRGTAQLNPRLASRPFLLHLTGSPSRAARAHEAYEALTYDNFTDIGHPELDSSGDLLDVPTTATDRFALIVQDDEAESVSIAVYQLTPQNPNAPFSLAYRYRIGGEYVRNALETSQDEQIQPLPEAGQ
ncbi:MAG: type II secretion system protein GspK [Pseudomonadota bacterium]|nr:type II secretion system protein GspK [Pseudomonadota bacterium]